MKRLYRTLQYNRSTLTNLLLLCSPSILLLLLHCNAQHTRKTTSASVHTSWGLWLHTQFSFMVPNPQGKHSGMYTTHHHTTSHLAHLLLFLNVRVTHISCSVCRWCSSAVCSSPYDTPIDRGYLRTERMREHSQ